MIRVLQIGMTDNYGGLESYIMNMYRNVNRDDIQFDFLALHNKEIAYEEEIKALGGRVYHVLYTRHELGRFRNPFPNLLKDYPYKIMHVHRTHLGDLDYVWMAKRAGISNRIIHAHSSGYINPLNKLAKLTESWNKKHLESISTHRLACSQAAGRWMFGDSDYKMAYNAIDLANYQLSQVNRNEGRLQFGFAADDIVVGHVGTFIPVKNHEFLIELLSQLRQIDSHYKLLLVGGGPRRHEIERLLESKGLLDAVKFAGSVTNVEYYYSLMDVFVLPSKFEGLPIVAIEAQANGLPVILSDMITREVSIGANVHYCSIEEVSQWVMTIRQLDVTRQDNRLILTETGYQIETAAAKLEKLYKELVEI